MRGLKIGREHIPVLLVLLIGVGFTVTLTWALHDRESKVLSTQFEKDALLYANALQREFERSGEIVDDLATFFQLLPNLSRTEFSQIAQTKLAKNGGIQALEWVPVVFDHQREEFENKARQFYPDFQFTELNDKGELIVSAKQEIYFPVFYLEPFIGNERALGYTPSNLSVRNDAINMAIKTSSTSASEKIELVQDTGRQSGILIFSPVFSSDTNQQSANYSIVNVTGLALGVFKLGDITQQALQNQKYLPLNLHIFNQHTESENSFLYGHDSSGLHQYAYAEIKRSESKLNFEKEFRLHNREWHVKVYPDAGFYMPNVMRSLGILTIGFSISVFIALLVYRSRQMQFEKEKALSANVANAQQTIDSKNTALMRQNNALTHLTQNIHQFSGSLNESLEDITETAAITLNAEIVSAWFLNDDKQIIQCFDYYILSSGKHKQGAELHAKNYPKYFEAIFNGEIIVAEDVTKDSRTSEFVEDYFQRFNIKSMLDVPLRHQGEIVGVVCIEHVDSQRQWSIEEIHFVNSIANFIALAVESIHRHQAELKLKHSSERLSLINAIANGTRSCISTQAVIDFAMRQLSQEFPQYRVSYANMSKDGLVEVVECYTPDTLINVKGAKVDLKVAPEFLSRLLKQEPVILTDMLSDERLLPLRKVIDFGKAKALLSYSLTRHNEKVDFIIFESANTHDWQEHEILTVKEVSEYLELAIRDARGQEARRRAEKALDNQKSKLEYLVEERTAELKHKAELEAMVANLSTRFINLPVEEYDQVIHKALESIGKMCRAERCNLFEVNADELTIIKSHHWLAPGIEVIIKENDQFELSELPWTYEQLKEKNIVYFDDPALLPGEASIDKQRMIDEKIKSNIAIPVVYGMKMSTIFNLNTQNYNAHWTPDEITLLQLVGNMLTNVVERKKYDEQLKRSEKLLKKSNKQLKDLATIDGLTGIANRRFFDTRLDSELNRSKREQTNLSIVLFDIDYFKQFNDEFGHVSGDLCLKRVATVIQNHCQRANELAARYGGEEFAVIVSNTSEEEVVALARRIRKSVQELAINAARVSNTEFLTLSGGVATLVPQMEQVPQDLIKAADTALYHAKASGRNCIKVAGSEAIVEFKRNRK